MESQNTHLPNEMNVLIKDVFIIFRLFVLQKVYRSDLNYLRGAAWIATGALQIEGSKRATDLISEVRCLIFVRFLDIKHLKIRQDKRCFFL